LSDSVCGVGSGVTAAGGSCETCPLGKFSLKSDGTQYANCDAGKSTNNIGTSSSTDCLDGAAGKHNQDGAGGACTDCIAGRQG